MRENVYEREKLYNEVWAEPVLTVAKRYGVSNVALKKVCKNMNIPVPPPGYWTKARAGAARLKKAPLPAYNGPDITYGNRPDIERDEQGKRILLVFLDDVERQKVLETCSNIEVKEQLRRPHSLIVEHRKEMARRKKLEREWEKNYWRTNYFNSHINKKEPDKKVLALRGISGESIKRAYRLMDAFIKTLETLGCSVIVDESDGNTYALVRGEKIQIYMKDAGGLVLHLDSYYTEQKNFRDTRTKTLDSVLGNAIIELFEASEKIRIDREKREQEERRRREEADRRLKIALRKEEETKRATALENEAMDWHRACIIRQYIAAIETAMQNDSDNERLNKLPEWISWAKDKADWFDPIISKEDLVLGRRRHTQLEGKKVK